MAQIENKETEYFDSIASERPKWLKRAAYFHNELRKYVKFLVAENSSILEIGCETGEFLAFLNPKQGLGIDCSKNLIDMARKNFPALEFKVGEMEDINKLGICEKFDYVIVNNAIGYVGDIQNALCQLRKICRPDTRVIVIYYNYLWEPLLKIAEAMRLRMRRPLQHWFSNRDIENFLYIADLEVIKKNNYVLAPFYIPFISGFLNKFFSNTAFFRKLSLIQILIARIPEPRKNPEEVSCSVIIPCRNEKGNIEQALLKIPRMGKKTEVIFVEGHSNDQTLAECERVKNKYKDMPIKVFVQDGIGKGDAVRKGFAEAEGDVLLILDGDLTVSPEELPKFFDALVCGKGEFINGSRLVYKMEKEAMRFLNILGNKFFSNMFTFLLEQYIKDTLCGTKALWRDDYKRIAKGRKYFGDFDPFGDFDLLFGAAKLNLKIIEVPVHYRQRSYGVSQISRFRHGWLLLKMTVFAMNKIKFI